MITVQDLRNEFELYKDDIDDVGQTLFIQWAKFTARFIYRQLKGIDPARFVKTSTIYAVTAAPQTKTLPTDFQDLNQTNCGLYFYDTTTSKVTEKKLPVTGYGSEKEGYYIEGTNLVFTGITDKSYYMKYMPEPPTISAMADYFTVDATNLTPAIVDDEFMEYLVKAIDVLYEQWDKDPTAESLADFRFTRALGQILSGTNRTPMVSVMPNPSNNF